MMGPRVYGGRRGARAGERRGATQQHLTTTTFFFRASWGRSSVAIIKSLTTHFQLNHGQRALDAALHNNCHPEEVAKENDRCWKTFPDNAGRKSEREQHTVKDVERKSVASSPTIRTTYRKPSSDLKVSKEMHEYVYNVTHERAAGSVCLRSAGRDPPSSVFSPRSIFVSLSLPLCSALPRCKWRRFVPYERFGRADFVFTF